MTKTWEGDCDVCVVGGAGHVGLPLALVLANSGFKTLILDIDQAALETISAGSLPFLEETGQEMLQKALPSKRLTLTSDPSSIRNVPNLILTIGTPVDEFHNPVRNTVTDCVRGLFPYMEAVRLIVLRSTVSPGTTEELDRFLKGNGKDICVAFCPERVVQGKAIKEVQTMAQIVSGTSPEAEERAAELFRKITSKIVRMKPMEAEFAKLICNTYRYIQFAATNQFFMMVESAGCDYKAVVKGMKEEYPRMRDFPSAGFAAGPCLHKDTLQMAAFANSQFELGHAAIHVNEGLPAFLVSRLKQKYPLDQMRVGILGMAFKADSDDIRSSLSYKLKKLFQHVAQQVLCTDPFVRNDKNLLPLEEVLEHSDLLVISAPHRVYATIKTNKPVIDIWNLRD